MSAERELTCANIWAKCREAGEGERWEEARGGRHEVGGGVSGRDEAGWRAGGLAGGSVADS